MTRIKSTKDRHTVKSQTKFLTVRKCKKNSEKNYCTTKAPANGHKGQTMRHLKGSLWKNKLLMNYYGLRHATYQNVKRCTQFARWIQISLDVMTLVTFGKQVIFHVSTIWHWPHNKELQQADKIHFNFAEFFCSWSTWIIHGMAWHGKQIKRFSVSNASVMIHSVRCIRSYWIETAISALEALLTL